MEAVIVWLAVAVLSLWVLYAVIKAAVKNGVKEALRDIEDEKTQSAEDSAK